MRTTLDIDAEVLKAAKKLAIDQGRPLRAVVETALRRAIEADEPAKSARFQWRTEGGGVLPGVDLSDWDSLRELMDRSDDRDRR
jgi:hypothetical protein